MGSLGSQGSSRFRRVLQKHSFFHLPAEERKHSVKPESQVQVPEPDPEPLTQLWAGREEAGEQGRTATQGTQSYRAGG